MSASASPQPVGWTGHHLERLSGADCRRLLAAGGVGRLAFPDGPAPVIVPVNFGLLGQDVVLRTAEGTVIDDLRADEGVAFEVDEIDTGAGQVWSVLVRGHLRRVTDPEEIAACDALRIPQYAPGERRHWMRIVASTITGRRIR